MPRAQSDFNPDTPPPRLFDGSHSMTPPLADTLADLLSMAASHTADRDARGLLLDAAARTFDAGARLRRLESCGRGAGCAT